MINLSDEMIEKAERLLVSGALTVALPATGPVAVCKGDTGVWAISRYADGSYGCSCPARNVCSHLTALSLVAAPADGAGLPAALVRLEDRHARQERAEAWSEWE